MTFAGLLAWVFGLLPAHHAHHHHHHKPKPVEHTALASWYPDGYGPTASGVRYHYGFASLIFGSQWGKRIRFCHTGCVVGRLDDHGPYVAGRTYDLNWALKSAIGCPDLCYVRWSVA